MNYLRIFCLAALGVLMAACSGDDATDGGGDNGTPTTHEPITVRLNLSTASSNGGRSGRAVPDWSNDAEKMRNWIIIIAHEGKIDKILTKDLSSNPLEDDSYSDVSGLLTNTEYSFYSFANMQLLDIGNDLTEGGTLPSDFDDTSSYKAKGNGFNPNEAGAGIPMSNKQTFYSSYFTEKKEYNIDLYVVRMYAKVELQITNMTSSAIKLKSVTLSDLTSNATDGDNIKLLPNPLNGGANVACKTNLTANAATADCTFGYAEGQSPCFTTDDNHTTFTKQLGDIEIEPSTEADKKTKNIVFYVNESATPTNNHRLFTLSLETVQGDGTTTTTTTTAKRYALITNDADDWNYIARNDYRIIPINLYDYKLELEVFKDAPIGVYPAVELKNDLFTVNFYDAGHFHLIPIVRKLSTDKEVPYSSTVSTDGSATWSLPTGGYTAKPTWAPSLTSYISGMAVTGQTEKGGWKIYEQNCSATADGSENGGQPKWIEKLDNAHLNSTTHSGSPGLLGKLRAAKSSTENYDGTAYHELKVQVNEGSTAHRELTYRICVNYTEWNKGRGSSE